MYLFLRRVLWSPFGRSLAGIRVNEHRMRALGFGTFGHKLAAFTLAGALAGLAGFLWAAQTGFVNPELMGFHLSAHAIMMVILGGMGKIPGVILGAFIVVLAPELLRDLGSFRYLIFAVGLLLIMLYRPSGIWPERGRR